MSKINWKTSTWPTEPKIWNTYCKQLLKDGRKSAIQTDLEEINAKSRNFPIKFPIIEPTCQFLSKFVTKDILERNIRSVYPILHEHALNLYAEFLHFKKSHGSNVEKQFYKDMTVPELVDRILLKRAVMFICESDHYILLDKTEGMDEWEMVGTKKEKSPLILSNCLSYDEIKLSALLSVSSYSYFLNSGDRANHGHVEQDRSILEEEGIVIGLIGTRLERPNVMEYQEMVITREQNTFENGYANDEKETLTRLFFKFYESNSLQYKQMPDLVSKEDERFVALQDGSFFDNLMYTRRLAISFDTLLLEANHRAKLAGKMAYIHVVGIGLGVWRISSHQQTLFVNSFFKRISTLGDNLKNVSDVDFAYISNVSKNTDYKNGETIPLEDHPSGGIKIHISRREPFTKLPETGKLLVVSYAWDGNALPGNEFWSGMLGSTSDSATAASSQIAELHNPHINKMVCHTNLMVATLKDGLLPLHDYIAKL